MAIKQVSLTVTVLLTLSSALSAATAGAAPSTGYIVETQGFTWAKAAMAVRNAGGQATHELPIINGVSATLTEAPAAKLRKNTQLELFADAPLMTQGSTTPATCAAIA